MRYGRSILAVAAVTLLLGLGGCDQTTVVKEALGLAKSSPDEFQVVSRAPLSLPPDFNLRPPQPGVPRPQEEAPRQQAQAAVFGNAGVSTGGAPAGGTEGFLSAGGAFAAETGGGSPGEVALLERAGAVGVDPTIRQVVDRETAEEVESDTQFVDRLVFWQKSAPPGQVVDPVKEQQRLEENAALGKPVTEGDTPVIIRRKRALLEGIF